MAAAPWWTADLLVAGDGLGISLVLSWVLAPISAIPLAAPGRAGFRLACFLVAPAVGGWFLLTLYLDRLVPVAPLLPVLLLLLAAGHLVGRPTPAPGRLAGGCAAALVAGLAVLLLLPPFTTVPDQYVAVLRPGARPSDATSNPYWTSSPPSGLASQSATSARATD
ncbi:hypothetical protein ACIQBJ_33505 [Kitasatospora sp. NPDC088391]|uniref:hypothetical protein n=1 Tax=Kitasatospora sp. NPDC088391 TaxID=3364074 RepID=UPI0037F23983